MTIWFLLLLIGFAALSYYLGFVRRRDPLSWLSQAALVVTVVILIPVVSATLIQEYRSLRAVAQYLTPYPHRTDVMAIPAVETDILLMVTTKDERETIVDFYRDENNRQGWQLARETPLGLTLVRDGLGLEIAVTENFGATERTIFYRLLEAENPVP